MLTKKKYQILLFFLISFSTAYSQVDFDKMMTKRSLDCEDISLNSAHLFQKYFSKAQYDSAQYLLDYWQEKCGLKEPLVRSKILLALNNRNFSDTLLPSHFLDYIFNYQSRIGLFKSEDYSTYDYYKPYFGYVPVEDKFDRFTQKAFGNLKSTYDPRSFEYLLCDFYATGDDSILLKIQSKQYASTSLHKEYMNIVDQEVKKGEFDIAWIVGIWIPRGKLATLGIHPQIGLYMGAKKKKMNYEGIITVNFGNSKNPYNVYLNDTVIPSTRYTGAFIGVDVGRDVFLRKGNEIQLVAGIGYEGFDVLDKDEENNIPSKSTNSYNLNIGISYRYYISNAVYLGLKAKYNFVDYTLNNLIDLTGNEITVQFLIGFLENNTKNKTLKLLKYKGMRK